MPKQKKKNYSDYLKELEQIKDSTERLKIELLLDIRYTLNNIDKLLKNKKNQ